MPSRLASHGFGMGIFLAEDRQHEVKIIAVAGRLPNWIWWHYPRDFMVIDIADVVIGWSLAALVMAALTGPENTRPGLSYRRVRL